MAGRTQKGAWQVRRSECHSYSVIAAEMEDKVYLMGRCLRQSRGFLSVLKEIVKISSEGLLRHTALSFKHKITTKAPYPIQYESGKFNVIIFQAFIFL